MTFDIVELFNDSLLYELNKHKLTTKDIKWIGSKDGKHHCEWNEFIKRIELLKLNQLEYDYTSLASYLTNLNSNKCLVVVGDSWWLQLTSSSRDETDYYWNFFKLPMLQVNSNPFHYLPGTISIKPFNEDNLSIEVKEYNSNNTLRELLNTLDVNDYSDLEFPFVDYNITLEEVLSIKNGVSLNESTSKLG